MFKALVKAAVGAALLPVDAVADAVTLGGVLSNRDETYTGRRVRDVFENLHDATRPDR